MAVHTTKTAITLDAFQWKGGLISDGTTVLPFWAKSIPLHSPGDGSLDVPTLRGTIVARVNDWVIQRVTGDIDVMSNASFTTYYT